jgi:hypothetical protein
MTWLIIAVVVLVLIAIAWWTSGRARRGVDPRGVDRVRSEGNRQAGNYDNPGSGGGGF